MAMNEIRMKRQVAVKEKGLLFWYTFIASMSAVIYAHDKLSAEEDCRQGPITKK